MNVISSWLSHWWAGTGKLRMRRNSDVIAFRLKSEATLMDPESHSTCCTTMEVERLRESTGVEPATRTLVRSNRIGHTVKVLLLKPESYEQWRA